MTKNDIKWVNVTNFYDFVIKTIKNQFFLSFINFLTEKRSKEHVFHHVNWILAKISKFAPKWPIWGPNLDISPKRSWRRHQKWPRGSKMSRNDWKPKKICESIEKIAFLAIFGPHFDHFWPKLGQNGPFLTPKWPFWSIFDPFLAENCRNLTKKWQKMQFFRLIRKVFAVSGRFWPFLTPWGHSGGPVQDLFFGTPILGVFGPNLVISPI